MSEEKMTYTRQVRDFLLTVKDKKKCCKNAAKSAAEFVTSGSIIDRGIFKCDECRYAFLREVFVCCASVNSPEKSNHLEFKLKNEPDADELCIFLRECGLEGKVSHRKNTYIVYFKDGDTIFEILSIIGANKFAFEMINTQIEKQIRNDCNRVANCEIANAKKTADASARVMNAIKELEKDGLLETLPEKLLETALLKKDNPDASLSTLAEMHAVPVTRSCVNHRLEKIVSIAERGTVK